MSGRFKGHRNIPLDSKTIFEGERLTVASLAPRHPHKLQDHLRVLLHILRRPAKTDVQVRRKCFCYKQLNRQQLEIVTDLIDKHTSMSWLVGLLINNFLVAVFPIAMLSKNILGFGVKGASDSTATSSDSFDVFFTGFL